MNRTEILNYCLEELLKQGAEQGECLVTHTEKYEITAESGEIMLIRSVTDTGADITAIIDNRKITMTTGQIEKEAVRETVQELMDSAKAAAAQDDLEPLKDGGKKTFQKGEKLPQKDKMYKLVDELLAAAKEKYPQINFRQISLAFNYTEKVYGNTKGTDFNDSSSYYELTESHTANKDGDTSGFYIKQYCVDDLNKELMQTCETEQSLKNAISELGSKHIDGGFTGDLLIHPESMIYFVQSLVNTSLAENTFLTNVSPLKDKIGEKILSDKITLQSIPTTLAKGYAFTKDGYEAKDLDLIKDGVLKSFILSKQGAKKTNNEYKNNDGLYYAVKGGDTDLESIIKSIDKGILLGRFSGGNASANGDFSGIAKNSFYIENGEIKHAVTETMISGNIFDLFNNVKHVSKEVLNTGEFSYPYVSSTGVNIQGS